LMAYRSRTFPEATLGSLPWMSMFVIALEDMFGLVGLLQDRMLCNSYAHAVVEYFMFCMMTRKRLVGQRWMLCAPLVPVRHENE
jgi:hypothetical protein